MFRILIIDDETDILEFVKYNLSRDAWRHAVRYARTTS